MWARGGEEAKNHSRRTENAKVRKERLRDGTAWFPLRGKMFAQGHGAQRENQALLTSPMLTPWQQAESKAKRGELRRKR